MRHSIKIVSISLLIFSFSKISSACLEDSLSASQGAMQVAVAKRGWWSLQADEILQKYMVDCETLVSRFNVLKDPRISRNQSFNVANQAYMKEAQILQAKFEACVPQFFSKPIEEFLKTIEPCCSVYYSSAPVKAFQGEFLNEENGGAFGIYLESITTNVAGFKPTIQFCKQMSLSAGKQHRACALHAMFQSLNIRQTMKLSTLDQMKNLFREEIVHCGESTYDENYFAKEGIRKDLESLTSNYKIHFMPFDHDLFNFIKILFCEIRNNPELRNALTEIKILPIPEQIHEIDVKLNRGVDHPDYQFPKVVLYCFGQKETQVALNILYKLFSGFPGTGRAPAFNEKVTDLIFFAQGDRQDKTLYPEWYDRASHMVYFDKNAIDVVAGCHISHDYTLKNPANTE